MSESERDANSPSPNERDDGDAAPAAASSAASAAASAAAPASRRPPASRSHAAQLADLSPPFVDLIEQVYGAVTEQESPADALAALCTREVCVERRSLFPVGEAHLFGLANSDHRKRFFSALGVPKGYKSLDARLRWVVGMIECSPVGVEVLAAEQEEADALAAERLQLEADAEAEAERAQDEHVESAEPDLSERKESGEASSRKPSVRRRPADSLGDAAPMDEGDSDADEQAARAAPARNPPHASPRKSKRVQLAQAQQSKAALAAAAAAAASRQPPVGHRSTGHASSAAALANFAKLQRQAKSGARKSALSGKAKRAHRDAEPSDDDDSDSSSGSSSSESGESGDSEPGRRKAKAKAKRASAASAKKRAKHKKRQARSPSPSSSSSSSDSSSSSGDDESSSSSSDDDRFNSLTGDALSGRIAKSVRKRLPNCTFVHYVERIASFNQERNRHECHAIAQALDRLEHEGKSYRELSMEILVRRFTGVHAADVSNSWKVAESIAWNERGTTLLPTAALNKVMKQTAAIKTLQQGGGAYGASSYSSASSGGRYASQPRRYASGYTNSGNVERTGRDRSRIDGGSAPFGSRERSSSRAGRGGRDGRGRFRTGSSRSGPSGSLGANNSAGGPRGQ
jgi:hypothetical protein